MALEHYDKFVKATEVSEVASSFGALMKELDCEDLLGLDVLCKVKEGVEKGLSFRLKKIFGILETALKKRKPHSSKLEGDAATKVFISGAGPCGLHCAVECALLGFAVTVVEKRTSFSRANILMLWSQTKDDLMSLGCKYFYPEMLTNGHPLHLGTREIQLCLLKTSLLLGVKVCYETSLVGFIFDQEQHMWCAQTKKYDKNAAKVGSAGLDFKPNKMGDYETTFKCNMVDKADLDADWISKRIEGAELHPFHACALAEGEWSQSSRKLGFKKQIDRFNQALGVVINLKYDRSNREEAKMKSFADSTLFSKSEMTNALAAKGIIVENVEYLKGRTHYIALSISKKTLLENEVLKQDLPSSDLLTEANLNVEMLKKMAMTAGEAIGLPSSVEFYESNPVQVFDFSSRARATVPVRVLTTETTSGTPALLETLPPNIAEVDKLTLNKRSHFAPVFPIGDALLEPFWPQGLGSNRGFHSCIDTAYVVSLLEEKGIAECVKERDFAYHTMVACRWWPGCVNQFKYWSIDPATRYSPKLLEEGRALMLHKKMPLAARWKDKKVITDMKAILKEGGEEQSPWG